MWFPTFLNYPLRVWPARLPAIILIMSVYSKGRHAALPRQFLAQLPA